MNWHIVIDIICWVIGGTSLYLAGMFGERARHHHWMHQSWEELIVWLKDCGNGYSYKEHLHRMADTFSRPYPEVRK